MTWKNHFDIGVVIPSKRRNCVVCINGSICKDCDKLNNQIKVCASNLHGLKRKPPNKFGRMLPYYKEEKNEILNKPIPAF